MPLTYVKGMARTCRSNIECGVLTSFFPSAAGLPTRAPPCETSDGNGQSGSERQLTDRATRWPVPAFAESAPTTASLPRHQSPLRAGRRLVGEATVVAVVHAAVARAGPACPAPRLLVLGRLAAEAGSNSSSTYAMPTGRSTRSGRRRRTRPCAPCAPAGVRPKHTSV